MADLDRDLLVMKWVCLVIGGGYGVWTVWFLIRLEITYWEFKKANKELKRQLASVSRQLNSMRDESE